MKIYESNDCLFLITHNVQPAPHRHMAAHIIVALDGLLQADIEGQTWRCEGILIPPDTRHLVRCSGKPVLVFLCDSATPAARQIRRPRVIPSDSCRRITTLYQQFTQNKSAAPSFEEAVFSELGLIRGKIFTTDERILSAMRMLRADPSAPVSCASAAASVFLSPSRFSHLFRQETGMPFAAFLIYQRLMAAYTDLWQGLSITEAAYNAGFCSSSHFADVHRRVFGLSATRVIQNWTFTKL